MNDQQPYPEGIPDSKDQLPLFPFRPETKLVDAASGEPVGPDADPNTQVVGAEQFGNGRRKVAVDLGGLVTAEQIPLGDAAPGLHMLANGGVAHVDEAGYAERLAPPPDAQK